MARTLREFVFTDDRIEGLPAPRGRQMFSDKAQPGLWLRVGAVSKTFVFFSRDAKGTRTIETIGRWSRTGHGGTFTVSAARARFLDLRGAEHGRAPTTLTLGELFDRFVERDQVSDYTAKLLRKHLESIRHMVAVDVAPVVFSDLVAKVQAGYLDEKGKRVGGAAVADKVRSGLRGLFEWAQRQGRFPQDRALPTIGLVREDFKGIGWKARERVPSERELHQLYDALGIGTGEKLAIDLEVSPKVSLAARLVVLLLAHVPVRSGVGLLAQPASAADLDAKVLRWATKKGGRDDVVETPLSSVAVEILKRLRDLDGGKAWLVPSPEVPVKADAPRHPLDEKTLARLFKRLQSPSPDGAPPRVVPDKGEEPFVPHTLRALWSSLAGDLGVDDGVAERVVGHKPAGASDAQRYYDRSQRLDMQRAAVERVSADLERIRQRLPRVAASVVTLRKTDG